MPRIRGTHRSPGGRLSGLPALLPRSVCLPGGAPRPSRRRSSRDRRGSPRGRRGRWRAGLSPGWGHGECSAPSRCRSEPACAAGGRRLPRLGIGAAAPVRRPAFPPGPQPRMRHLGRSRRPALARRGHLACSLVLLSWRCRGPSGLPGSAHRHVPGAILAARCGGWRPGRSAPAGRPSGIPGIETIPRLAAGTAAGHPARSPAPRYCRAQDAPPTGPGTGASEPRPAHRARHHACARPRKRCGSYPSSTARLEPSAGRGAAQRPVIHLLPGAHTHRAARRSPRCHTRRGWRRVNRDQAQPPAVARRQVAATQPARPAGTLAGRIPIAGGGRAAPRGQLPSAAATSPPPQAPPRGRRSAPWSAPTLPPAGDARQQLPRPAHRGQRQWRTRLPRTCPPTPTLPARPATPAGCWSPAGKTAPPAASCRARYHRRPARSPSGCPPARHVRLRRTGGTRPPSSPEQARDCPG